MSGYYKKCDCHDCQRLLTTFDEVMSGICTDHMKLAEDNNNFIGVCWNCCRITVIGTRLDRRDNLVIKDKYIFSKDCQHCAEGSDGMSWMTINAGSPATTMMTPKGRFIPITTTSHEVDHQHNV